MDKLVKRIKQVIKEADKAGAKNSGFSIGIHFQPTDTRLDKIEEFRLAAGEEGVRDGSQETYWHKFFGGKVTIFE